MAAKLLAMDCSHLQPLSELSGLPIPQDGKPVVFVDTPSFGDTVKSDTEILAMLTEWLVKV
jgi:hypothetical protein